MTISSLITALKEQGCTITATDGTLSITGYASVSISMQVAVLVLRPTLLSFLETGTDASFGIGFLERTAEDEFGIVPFFGPDGRTYTCGSGDEALIDLLNEELGAPWSKPPVDDDYPVFYHRLDGTKVVRRARFDLREPVEISLEEAMKHEPSAIDYDPPREGDAAMGRPKARRR